MLNIQSYGSSNEEDSDQEEIPVPAKPISSEFSVAKSIQIVAAPVVVPLERQLFERKIDPKEKELIYNPKYEELFAPVQGPDNPFLSEQQKAPKNTATGFIEKAHVSDFQFENQRRTFHSYGYALDPTAENQTGGENYIGPNLEAAYNSDGKTVFESNKIKPENRRKRHKNDDSADLDGFLGPWGKYVDEKLVAQPTDTEKAEIEEMMAKKQRRNKREVEEKPVEEKSVLHISDSVDYQGRSFLHPPHDVGVSLKAGAHPDRCFLPKAHIHTWTGHTKGISAIKLFPKSAHLLLSCGMDAKIKIFEVYNERRCVRTYTGHRQAVRDVDFNARGTQFVSAGYDRYLKLWDTETGAVVSRFTSRKIPYCVKFHPDYNKQHLFVCGTSDKKILCVSVPVIDLITEYLILFLILVGHTKR